MSTSYPILTAAVKYGIDLESAYTYAWWCFNGCHPQPPGSPMAQIFEKHTPGDLWAFWREAKDFVRKDILPATPPNTLTFGDYTVPDRDGKEHFVEPITVVCVLDDERNFEQNMRDMMGEPKFPLDGIEPPDLSTLAHNTLANPPVFPLRDPYIGLKSRPDKGFGMTGSLKKPGTQDDGA